MSAPEPPGPEPASLPPEVTSRSLLVSVGPRLLRDILGPTVSFYVVWKLTGNVVAGIAVGSTVSFAAYRYERRRNRPGVIARLVLAFVVVQAVIGLVTGSATAYLVQPSVLGAVNGVVWLGSVAIRRPLAAVFAGEVFPVSEETRKSELYRSVFRFVSLAFGLFFVVFSVIQLVVLLIFGVDAYVACRVADALGIMGMIVFCVRRIVARLGPQLRAALRP